MNLCEQMHRHSTASRTMTMETEYKDNDHNDSGRDDSHGNKEGSTNNNISLVLSRTHISSNN